MRSDFTSAGRTETGKVRRHNEDAILLRDDVGLWAVADGLGGHTAGDHASNAVMECLRGLPRDGDLADFLDSIELALDDVNGQLRTLAKQRGVDVIGSTVVVLVHDRVHDLVMCGWVGDSRAYLHEDGVLRQLTRDHVVGDKDDITHFGGGPKAGSGALTRAVGAFGELAMDWTLVARRNHQQFLLCSDGINKEMSDAEIAGFCGTAGSPTALIGHLFDTALGRAARDNLSAVALYTGDGEPDWI